MNIRFLRDIREGVTFRRLILHSLECAQMNCEFVLHRFYSQGVHIHLLVVGCIEEKFGSSRASE